MSLPTESRALSFGRKDSVLTRLTAMPDIPHGPLRGLVYSFQCLPRVFCFGAMVAYVIVVHMARTGECWAMPAHGCSDD